jgi:hypothetical protein
MKILIYIATDLLSTLIIFALSIKLQYYLGGSTDYILIGVVCLFVGLIFSYGLAHGGSIAAEIIALHMAILFMIGRPMSAPLSDVLNLGIIGPMLPFIPTGLIAGFIGGQIRKYRKKEDKGSG